MLLHLLKKSMLSLIYVYSLNGDAIHKLSSIRALEVLLETKQYLELHIQNIVNNSFKMFGFVM